ncbi:hypothetical protein J5N97_013552 [Dioscorea zingiberensis]|uniref:Uncharacterized protein n=1 Tax=Dioscorea zingiberensis TaxID=325984 RepID=A0A9D5HIW6_9LILI|nr:hypothetical protein J5N97_013552 [Dioscorea zingiberensis]
MQSSIAGYKESLSRIGNEVFDAADKFGNLSSLRRLDWVSNQLSGEIPSSLGKLTKLQIMILSGNNLSGRIPDSFSNLAGLNDIFTGNSLISH